MLSANAPAMASTGPRSGALAIISSGSLPRPINAPITFPAIDAIVSVSPPQLEIASHVASVNWVSSDNRHSSLSEISTGGRFPSCGPPRASPIAPPRMQPRIWSRTKLLRKSPGAHRFQRASLLQSAFDRSKARWKRCAPRRASIVSGRRRGDLLADLLQRMQLRQRAAGFDRMRGHFDRDIETVCRACDEQRSGGVDQNQVARLVFAPAFEHIADDRGVLFRRTSAQMFNRGAPQPEIFGRDLKTIHAFGRGGVNDRFAGERNFIQPVFAAYNPGATGSQPRQHASDLFAGGLRRHSSDLERRARRIGQRAK